jgi:hypothetical protein
MKLRVLSVLIILIGFFQPDLYMQQKNKTPGADLLFGNWETVPNPLETSTLRLEFKPGKKFSYILTSSWHGSYKLEGTKLVSSLSIPFMNKIKTDTSTVFIFSDTLIQIGNEKGKETTLRMIRKKDSTNTGAGLVGTWVIQNQDAEYSTISYSLSGTFEMNNILKSFYGNYRTKSDTLMAFSRGYLMLKNRFVIDKGLLRIYSPVQSGPITLEKVQK